MSQNVKTWFDTEADFLEVLFFNAPGYMRETDNDAVLERLNSQRISNRTTRVTTRCQTQEVAASLE